MRSGFIFMGDIGRLAISGVKLRAGGFGNSKLIIVLGVDRTVVDTGVTMANTSQVIAEAADYFEKRGLFLAGTYVEKQRTFFPGNPTVVGKLYGE